MVVLLAMEKKTIYLLEDDKDIAYILNYVLFEEGYEVLVFPTISSCKQALNKRVPDLLLMDVRLPDGNGMDLCSELKNSARTTESKILMMSAHLPEQDGKQTGADDFIAKPFDLEGMVSRIGYHLKHTG